MYLGLGDKEYGMACVIAVALALSPAKAEDGSALSPEMEDRQIGLRELGSHASVSTRIWKTTKQKWCIQIHRKRYDSRPFYSRVHN